MKLLSAVRVSIGVLIAVAMATVQPAFAANYPLEILNIKPAGTGGMVSTHRIYRAYPGLEYNIRAAIAGGAYPYTFSLSNAPAGMTIDARGTIVWVNPQADATPTITVRDSEGTQVSASWTIDVTTNGFKFLDAVNGSDSAAGTASAPWRTFQGLYNRGLPAEIIYWRAGMYTPAGIPVENDNVANGEERIVWNGSERPTTWLAYPGERPVFDFGYTGAGYPYGTLSVPRIRISEPNMYIDGFEFRRSMTMAFQVNQSNTHATTFRRNHFDRHGPGIDGGNSAFIMFVAGANQGVGTIIQDNTFSNIQYGSANCALKLYMLHKVLIEDNVFRDTTPGSEGVLAIKATSSQYMVRGNLFYNIGTLAIGGNQNSGNGVITTGEMLYNTVLVPSGGALELNQNGAAGQAFIYRNTFVGTVLASNVDGADGPFRLYFNVIVNNVSGTPSGSHITHGQVSDPSRIILTNNLTGYPSNNIVDSQGQLTAGYASYLGTHGAQLGNGPRPPTNVRIIR